MRPQSVCPLAVAAGMNGWLFVGPCDDSPGAHQFTKAPWNIRSWLTRLWGYSLASLCWFCPSYSSGPPGRTAGSLKKAQLRNTAAPLTQPSLSTENSPDIRYCVFYLICSCLLAKAPGNHIKISVPYFLTNSPLWLKNLSRISIIPWLSSSCISLHSFMSPCLLPTCSHTS